MCWRPISAATAGRRSRGPLTPTPSSKLSAGIVGLLDDVGADRAALIGHDFGGVVAWNAPLLHPDRFAGIAGLSVPPVPRSKVPTTQAFRKIFGDNFFYILYFQESGPADAELNRDPATTLRKLMGSLTTTDEAAALRMLQPGPEGFIDRIPDPGGCPTGSARTSSTTTSGHSPGPASPHR